MAVNQANVQGDNASEVSVLRIGIAKNREMIEERLIAEAGSLSIGSQKYCTFVLEGLPESLGERYVLFEERNNEYYLSFTDEMEGVLVIDGQSSQLSELVDSKSAVPKRKGYSIHFKQGSKGKVVIGDFTFLFQFAAVPAVALRDTSSYKDSLLDEQDYIFLGFLGFFSLVAGLTLFWIINQPRPELLQKEEVEKLMAQYLDVPPEEPEETVEEPEEPSDEDLPEDPNNVVQKQATETKPEPTPEKDVPPKEVQEAKAEASANMSSEDKAAAEEAVSKSFLFQQLATTGDSKGGGFVSSAFGQGNGEGADLDAVLDGVTDGHMAKTDAQMSLKGQIDKSGKAIAEAGVVKAGKGGDVKVSKGPATKAPVASAKIQKIDTAMGECSSGITKTVSKHIAQIKACHSSALKANPTIAGRVVVDVEIVDGKVVMAKVSQNKTGDPGLASCIEKRIKKWKFPSDCSDLATFPFALSPKK